MRKWITLIIGLLLVGGSAVGFAKYMKSYELDITTMNTIKPVKMIQAGELITESMIRTVSIPTAQHMENSIIDPKKLIGKRAIVPIGESEEILSWKIGEDTLYPKDNEEYIGFKVDFVGAVNNMVRRGDKVDVWVEYTQPKMYDENGIELDQAEQARRIAANPANAKLVAKKIYNKLLIKNLTVAYVKDQEGKEITDSGSPKGPQLQLPESATQRDEANAERYRQNASGQPSYITFIMSPEQYASFAEGAKEGTIRLGLPSTTIAIGTIEPTDTKVNATDKKQNTPADNNLTQKTSEIIIMPDARKDGAQSPNVKEAVPTNNSAVSGASASQSDAKTNQGGTIK